MFVDDTSNSPGVAEPADLTTKRDASSEREADWRLLESIGQGDNGAFAELYQRQGPVVYNYLLRLIHDQNLAEDLLQESFVAIWQGAGRFKRQASVKSWILRIAHNKAVSWLRHNRPESMAEDQTIVSEELGPESLALLNSRNEELLAALDALSANHRAVVELVFVHELSYTEISQIMDCPVGTVKSRMSYALQHLQRILARSAR